ncbi:MULTISPECIES: hypothetical protein [unclassified Acinetobacter]|uniref:hypothetical protein n=1 Tax=unclassified Acinetobacter TaxID=196816 RepID=UPI0025761A62|nr:MULTISPECIES: hypothetical protein [unclassified Acinetobacter]MDM1763373.1 hypothetical protein [Acinetobacter sp. 226-1]MDM1766852.1 hypothetical protein [Acinetobacter sp. 226-4]
MVIFGKPFGTWVFTKEINSIEDDSIKDQLINNLCSLLIILEKYGVFFPKLIELYDNAETKESSSIDYNFEKYSVSDQDDYKQSNYWYQLFYKFNHAEKKIPFTVDISGLTLLLDNSNKIFVEDGFFVNTYFKNHKVIFILSTYATDWLPYRADLRGGINPDYEVNAERLEQALLEFTKTCSDYEVEQIEDEIEAYDPNRLFRLVNQRYAEFEGVEEIVLYDPSGRMMGSYNPVTGEVE